MVRCSALGSVLAGAALLASSVQAQSVDPIVIQGKHFFYSTNHTEFFIRGVAYQQNFSPNSTDTSNGQYIDPLADVSACMRDIPYLVALRTNVIRTYAIDPTQDHSGCVNAFAAAGIYIISDLSSPAPGQSINRNTPSWTTDLYQRYTSVVDSLSSYPNVIGFFAGNEVSNSYNTTLASAFVRAAVRDTKSYIAQNVNRPIYVGYASYDGPIRNQLAQYFNCGNQSSAIDFWGYNVYSWCGDSNYVDSGYQARTQFFQSYSVPVFFAEYGCNTAGNQVIVRPWTEVQAIFGPNMTGVWSGGIAYQYFQDVAEYGLVNISGNTVTPNQDYDNLSSQMAKATPSTTAYSAINSGTPTTCPSVDYTSWFATATPLPPTPRSDLCNCLPGTLGCVINPSASNTTYGSIFNYVCGLQNTNYCNGISANAETGNYGVYGMCNAQVQLDYVLNQYYQANKNNYQVTAPCGFTGAGTQAAATPTGTCASLLGAAASSISASGGSGSGSSSSTSKSAAVGTTMPSSENAYLYFGLYVVAAIATGAGALVL